MSLVFNCMNATRHVPSKNQLLKYIVTISEPDDITVAAHAIDEQTRFFNGYIDRVLSNVRIFIIVGDEKTCEVLQSVVNVVDCRKDVNVSYL